MNLFTKQKQTQFSSVAQSCPTLCDPMTCSTPGLPAHHQLLEFTQTHRYREQIYGYQRGKVEGGIN